MNVDREKQIMALYERALTLPEGERAAFLRENCGEDEKLQEEVRALLGQDLEKVDFLSNPIATGLPPLPKGSAIDRYRILRELGRGGMGQVYLAEQEAPFRHRVAIKIMSHGLDTPTLIPRFENERQILADLNHPNIARLFDGGTLEDGRPYFVMEYVEGEPIHDYCNSRQLALEARLKLFQKVCSAVHFAHQNLVVHRDLKPQNILVTEDGEPKLLDFGIAKLLQPKPSQTSTLTTMGARPMTLAYASPEQILGKPVTTASDVYSLGVLLYEILTGARPYRIQSGDWEEIQRVICEQDPLRPSLAGAEADSVEQISSRPPAPRRPQTLAGEIDEIVLMSLRKEPERRYASAAQLSEDITRFLGGFPVIARKDRFGYFAKKFIYRHRFGAAVAAIGFLLSIGFSFSMAFQQNQIKRQRDKAERISNFLTEIFNNYDPYKTDGETVTVETLLNQASAQIDRELKEEPEVRAGMNLTLAKVYTNIGSYEKALPLYEETLAIQQDLFGDDHRELGDTLYSLGKYYLATAEYAKAETFFTRALDIRGKNLGKGHAKTAAVMHDLGQVRIYQGRFEEAKDWIQQAVNVQQNLKGESLGLASSLNDLAIVYYNQARFPETESLYSRALDLQEKELGPDHPTLAETLNNLAQLYKTLTRYDEAVPLHQRALSIRRQAFGDNHREVAHSLNNLGTLYTLQQRYDEAEPLLRQALSIKEAALGPQHPEVAISLNYLAELFVHQQKYEEADRLFRRNLAIVERVYGSEHPEIAYPLHNLANLHKIQGNYPQAESQYLAALEVREKALGPNHPRVAIILHAMAELYMAQELFAKAEPLCERALRIREEHFGQDHALVAEILTLYAQLLKKLNRDEAAKALAARAEAIAAR